MSKPTNTGLGNHLSKINLKNEPFQIGKLYHTIAPIWAWETRAINPENLGKVQDLRRAGVDIPAGSHLLFIKWDGGTNAVFLFEDKKVWVTPGSTKYIYRGRYLMPEIIDPAPDEQ